MLDRVGEPVAVHFRNPQKEADRLHRQFGGHVHQEVAILGDRGEQPPHPAPQLVLQSTHRRRRQATGDEPTDPRVPWVVHHVQDHSGHREVLNDGPSVGPIPPGLGREGHRVVEDLEHLVIGGHRPEPFAVGRVRGWPVPPHRSDGTVEAEDVVREAEGEGVQVGQIDVLEATGHRAILTGGPLGVKNVGPGA